MRPICLPIVFPIPMRIRLKTFPRLWRPRGTEVSSLLEIITANLPCATVFLNTLSCVDQSGTYRGLEYNSQFGFRQIVDLYNASLCSLARNSAGTVVVDVEALIEAFGAERWHDPRLWYLGRIRMSAQAHGLLASEYARFIEARWGGARKCIVLDLDNTLWGGIVGEDGMSGLQLGNEGIGLAFLDFQRELLNLQQKGILLAICSKNNSEDALEVIRKHPSMVLRESHFAATQINWNEKSENICEIARRLNIGLDSLVFIDDSPVERLGIRKAIPEVAVPEWPSDPCYYKRALGEVTGEYFLKLQLTEDDRRRGTMYQAQAERARYEESAGNLEDFFRSLQMTLTIDTVNNETLPRVSQLIQKTNQFNLTTRRYTQSEVAAMAADPGFRTYWLDLEDRFGPNGIVGVLIMRRQSAKQWQIDTFLLSCRVIGRTVENAFLAFALHDLRNSGASCITGEYIPSAKNGIVAKLYDRLGFTRQESDECRSGWMMDLNNDLITMPEWFTIKDKGRVTTQ